MVAFMENSSIFWGQSRQIVDFRAHERGYSDTRHCQKCLSDTRHSGKIKPDTNTQNSPRHSTPTFQKTEKCKKHFPSGNQNLSCLRRNFLFGIVHIQKFFAPSAQPFSFNILYTIFLLVLTPIYTIRSNTIT